MTVDEVAIRARLERNSMVVSVPVVNNADHAVKATLELQWLTHADRLPASERREVSIARGRSVLDAPYPLDNPSIWTRLRYTLTPVPSEARTFSPVSGVLSLSHIAAYAFELRAAGVGQVRRGSPFTVTAQAIHPVSRKPLSDVEWEATLSIDDSELAAKSVVRRQDGFVELTFDVPATASVDPDDDASVEVTARRGDFEQSASFDVQAPARLSARFQTDKPIYQPGQILHLRAVIQDASERAAAGAKVTLRVDGQDGDRLRTLKLTASKFGVVQDDWTIPDSASQGVYQLSFIADGDEDYQIGRHMVRVSRYELPSFAVKAKPDKPVYLPGDAARVNISASYLFGKPVKAGRVKIIRAEQSDWNSKSAKWQSRGATVAEGDTQPDGTFTALIDLQRDHEELKSGGVTRFRDLRFDAYFTDGASRRTEQRRFDLRVTREPIHVYAIRANGAGSLPAPVFVSTSYADGSPVSALVEVRIDGQTSTVRTNRHGVGKIDLPPETSTDDPVTFKATTSEGLSGTWIEQYWFKGSEEFRLQSLRTIHRAGDAVTLRITAPSTAPGEQSVMIYAVTDGRVVASRVVELKGHSGETVFPFQPDFQRTVVFVAWNGVQLPPHESQAVLASRAVIFPGAASLNLSVTPGRSTYKPGENASVRVQVSSPEGKPVEAALALAVVDQAVLERARTDSDFGARPWFNCAFCADDGETEVGGIRLNDLFALKPSASITPELDLAAELLAARAGAYLVSQTSETFADVPAFESVAAQMARLRAALDRHYAESLTLPQNDEQLSAIAREVWFNATDPWERAYRVEFGIDRSEHVISISSSGPDKLFGTGDDFVAGRIRRSYFAAERSLIQRALSQVDYPASSEDLVEILSQRGLLLRTLRDPWGTPYRSAITTVQSSRHVALQSAGPDRAFQTKDDFEIARFSGAYFRRETAQIRAAIEKTVPAPQSVEEFTAALTASGLNPDQYRDAWGKPYRVASSITSRYADRRTTVTTRVFAGVPENKTISVPVTQKYVEFALRSAGPDGTQGTYDDFDIARFPVLLAEESAASANAASPSRPSPPRAGTGAVAGNVTDVTGAAVPNADVQLINSAGTVYESVTGTDGAYHFGSVPTGAYHLKVFRLGFMPYTVVDIPVTAGKPTTVDVQLSVGQVAQTVTVEASGFPLQMQAASVSRSTRTATPRVREYFPETLLWLPELLSGPGGVAVSRFALADSITTWKVAAFASSMDGRWAEADAEFRAFQPFFADFNPPLVLTEGDQIELPVAVRNYQRRDEITTVRLEPNDWSIAKSDSVVQLKAPANDSATASFTIQAKRSLDKAAQRITAKTRGGGDAVEKSLSVHPDGQQVVQTFGDFSSSEAGFHVGIPAEAIAGANRAELRIYPNIASLLLESSSAILQAPHGCAEQIISAGHANLIALRFARSAGASGPELEKRALSHIRQAVDSLAALNDGNGGVSYWRNGEIDVAVTAHALTFLLEASALVAVDQDDIRRIVSRLEAEQTRDGLWKPRSRLNNSNGQPGVPLTSLVARALSSARKAGLKVSDKTLAGAYHHLTGASEPYVLANFILAALDSGHDSLLDRAVATLAATARQERGGVYWDLRSNSPFHGWGTAGRHEATGVAVQALSAWRRNHAGTPQLDSSIRQGLVFLLRGRDSFGGWRSTQSTLQAMQAISSAASTMGMGTDAGTLEVRFNGRVVKSVALPDDTKQTDPVLVDLSPFLSAGENRITITPTGSMSAALFRLTATHWLPWDKTAARSTPEMRFSVTFDRSGGNAGEPVRCSVKAERVGFRGYGMLLAEIGLPPATEVDRSSLQSLLDDPNLGVDHYEVQPDRVVLYLWPAAGGSSFAFFVTPRNAMDAKSAPSILYDYYNPEALMEVAPSRWTIR